jgi:acyl-coenzyme A thioesterase PaaI-like protein
MALKHKLDFCKALYSSHFWNLGLARTLGIFDGKILSASKEEGIVVRTVPPAQACLPDEPVSCGVLAALADEWTTQGFVLQDSSSRPGVTVALSLDIHRPINVYPNTPLLLRSNCTKIGKSLGFCEFSISDEASGITFATGSHVKYLPMGLWFETLTWRPLLPYTVSFATKTFLRPLSENPINSPIPTIKALFEPGES